MRQTRFNCNAVKKKISNDKPRSISASSLRNLELLTHVKNHIFTANPRKTLLEKLKVKRSNPFVESMKLNTSCCNAFTRNTTKSSINNKTTKSDGLRSQSYSHSQSKQEINHKRNNSSKNLKINKKTSYDEMIKYYHKLCVYLQQNKINGSDNINDNKNSDKFDSVLKFLAAEIHLKYGIKNINEIERKIRNKINFMFLKNQNITKGTQVRVETRSKGIGLNSNDLITNYMVTLVEYLMAIVSNELTNSSLLTLSNIILEKCYENKNNQINYIKNIKGDCNINLSTSESSVSKNDDDDDYDNDDADIGYLEIKYSEMKRDFAQKASETNFEEICNASIKILNPPKIFTLKDVLISETKVGDDCEVDLNTYTDIQTMCKRKGSTLKIPSIREPDYHENYHCDSTMMLTCHAFHKDTSKIIKQILLRNMEINEFSTPSESFVLHEIISYGTDIVQHNIKNAICSYNDRDQQNSLIPLNYMTFSIKSDVCKHRQIPIYNRCTVPSISVEYFPTNKDIIGETESIDSNQFNSFSHMSHLNICSRHDTCNSCCFKSCVETELIQLNSNHSQVSKQYNTNTTAIYDTMTIASEYTTVSTDTSNTELSGSIPYDQTKDTSSRTIFSSKEISKEFKYTNSETISEISSHLINSNYDEIIKLINKVGSNLTQRAYTTDDKNNKNNPKVSFYNRLSLSQENIRKISSLDLASIKNSMFTGMDRSSFQSRGSVRSFCRALFLPWIYQNERKCLL